MKLTKPQKLIYDMEKYAGGTISIICGSMLSTGQKDTSELKQAVNKMYQLNDALRIHIRENNEEVYQEVMAYAEQRIEVLYFESKTELDIYAEDYAKIPLDLYGNLCEIKIVILPEKYGLLVKLHHMIGDAWTLSLMGTQFHAILSGQANEVYSYIDYVESENKYIDSKRYEKDRNFFLQQFQKCDEVTYLNAKRSTTLESHRKTYVIKKNEAKQIVDYVQKKDISVFMLFTTILSTYMNRVKMNQEKFYIGTAVLNRNGVKEKNTMGMFVNTVPMLLELDNTKSFAENLKNIEQTLFSVLRHQKYNYGEVLSAIRREYGFSEKLYDVMISYQNATITGGESETTWYHSGLQSESLQIHIDDRDNEGIFRIHYDYLTEKFNEHEIEMLHQHMCNLLFDAIRNDDRKLYELEILSEEEKKKLLYEFNDTTIDYPRDKCVHQLFEEQVEKTPDKVAVVACDRTLTYAQLNAEANRIAHGLIKSGVKVGDIVAFALPRDSYLIATMLGILKAGAAYLPIDLNYPQDRIDFMLEDSRAKVFITKENINEFYDVDGTNIVGIKNFSENLCYCIYTSGSTGNPKGTLIKHKGLVNLVTNLSIYQEIERCKIFGFTTTIVFDVATQEIFTALLNAYSGVLFPERKETSVDDIVQKLIDEKVDVIYVTPTYLDLLAEKEDNAIKILRNIKVVVLAGEQFKIAETLQKELENYEIIFENQYGPAETHVVSATSNTKDKSDITIGKPIANTKIYIIDQYMKPTPIGITGELCIAGDCVGVGYLNRPELTAEKFIDNPFGEGKLYKTGDLAYWREDGNIVYVGRNDFQVKIRGLRIELGEIENAICNVNGISQAVVVVRKNADGRQLICAFYTGKEVLIKEIRKSISKKLPKYMVPHIITHLEEIPLTSSGKVNRKALPEVDLNVVDTMVEYIAPKTEKEVCLVQVMEEILGIEKVGILDNFFDVGGDSLKAIELISKLEKQGYHTEIKTIFAAETIKELADALIIESDKKENIECTGDIPATDAQMRIYTSQNMQQNSRTYNLPYIFKAEEVDAGRLQNAIDSLISRHEILRTYFENKDGKILQIVDKNAKCEVEILSSNDISAFIRPFVLSKAPLIRVGVYDKTIMIDMHHIITDGASMPIFIKELNELYVGRKLENIPIQYKQFAVQKSDYSESEKYWLSVYKDELPVLELNTDFHRGQKQSFRGNAVYDVVDIGLHNKILDLCKAKNITPYVFYMSAFNILLSKYSGNEDIAVGMPISGRKAEYLETIGMFVNTIALRNKPIGSKNVLEFLQEVKENSISAIVHQDYPYGELIKKLGVNAQGRNPLFDVMFAYQSEKMTDVIFADKKGELLPIPITTSKYDFTFNIMPREEDVVIMVEYCTDLYKESTIQRLMNSYKLVLEQLLECNKQVQDVSAISEVEEEKLLYRFNNTTIDYEQEKGIYQFFEEQVRRKPEKKAVIFDNSFYTYLELSRIVQSYANKLAYCGIKENDVVAIHLERSHKLIAFQLAVLKIGAVFLPVDKRYPFERIEYMYRDCDVKLLISDSLDSSKFNGNIMSIDQFGLIDAKISVESVNNTGLCYIIYTSGSTGTPKGCMLTGKGLVNFCKNNNTLETLMEYDENIFACVNSVSFDYFIAESLLPLTNGYTTVVFSDDESTIQERFLENVKKNKINVVMTTPTRLKIYFDNKCDCIALQQLQCICTSGEPLTVDLLAQMYEKSPYAQIYNPIGPSECSVWDIGGKLKRQDGLDVHIGKPIANTQIYIVNKNMKITPIGVTGELCIAGDGVGAGYLNCPELTAEKFIDNPFGEGKLYKTGDLAYWREDGNIVYVGRNDFQVKIRGLRIELGEIENAICEIDGISQSVVVVRKNGEDRQFICAFYTGTELDAKEIRKHIGQKLPKYMLPHVCTYLPELPLTSSGKINRKALPEIDLDNITNETEYVSPENQRQKELCSILETVLGTTPIGITDDFFDLGGDSLKAIEYVSKAHSEGIYFNLQNVFDYPTVKALCDCIENGDKQEISFAEVDFTHVNKILERNRLEDVTASRKAEVGNILLAGATGYLGIHLLADYLDNDTGIAYCIVRGSDKENCTKRLKDLLQFYFSEKYADMHRIEVICGDLQKDNFGLDIDTYQRLVKDVDMVINAAASVKHYGSYKYFYEANVETTQRLIEFCKEANAKLIHTSTLSVSGNSFGDQFDGYVSETEKHFYESSLYIEQPLDNVYVRSKFEAEKAVLDAMTEGLQANIMRMGNLTNRFSDGVFQKNHENNAFLQRIKSVLVLGVAPDYLLGLYAEFTPIDEAAKAVMMIARHFSNEQTVFHINSTKVVYMDKLHDLFNQLGFDLKIVSGTEFTDRLRQTIKQSGMEYIFETFINDMDENDKLNYDSNIHIENDFTVEYLQKLGFEWSDIGLEYLRKYLDYFKGIGYLNDTPK